MKKKKKIITGVTALLVCAAAVCCVAFASSGPATQSDPIITKSYVDDVVLPQVYQYIDTSLASSTGSVFEIVSVKKGQKLIAGAGSELIARMGEGSIIASSQGGISDVTSGSDLSNGTAIPLNHHLIVPVDDGRGLKISSDALIMVKGSYTIQ